MSALDWERVRCRKEHEFETDLRKMIGRGQVVAVVGSGVSMATTSRAPTWRGLMASGVERCRTVGAADKWCQRTLGLLEPDSDADMLLSAAELVQQKLREHGGEFARWLRDTFAELQPDDPTVIRLLTDLGTPLVTTNYDDLIEQRHVAEARHVEGYRATWPAWCAARIVACCICTGTGTSPIPWCWASARTKPSRTVTTPKP